MQIAHPELCHPLPRLFVAPANEAYPICWFNHVNQNGEVRAAAAGLRLEHEPRIAGESCFWTRDSHDRGYWG
jgi:hypothetical protein